MFLSLVFYGLVGWGWWHGCRSWVHTLIHYEELRGDLPETRVALHRRRAAQAHAAKCLVVCTMPALFAVVLFAMYMHQHQRLVEMHDAAMLQPVPEWCTSPPDPVTLSYMTQLFLGSYLRACQQLRQDQVMSVWPGGVDFFTDTVRFLVVTPASICGEVIGAFAQHIPVLLWPVMVYVLPSAGIAAITMLPRRLFRVSGGGWKPRNAPRPLLYGGNGSESDNEEEEENGDRFEKRNARLSFKEL